MSYKSNNGRKIKKNGVSRLYKCNYCGNVGIFRGDVMRTHYRGYNSFYNSGGGSYIIHELKAISEFTRRRINIGQIEKLFL